MATKDALRARLQEQLDETIGLVNDALRGRRLKEIEPVLQRIGRGQQLPHWYSELQVSGTLPNLDGKTIGSVIEMVLVGVLERWTLKGFGVPPLKINPARGVDLPDLDLGVKSPSENYCTSEPFFSAYERLLGSAHDVLVLLTDYQTAKRKPPLKLQIIDWKYLRSSQIADKNLCRIAKKHRDWLVEDDVGRGQRFFRFLAYVNQSDWRAKRLLAMVADLDDQAAITEHIATSRKEFEKANRVRLKKDQVPIEESEIQAIERIARMSPRYCGVLDAAENWLVETRKESARPPSASEWSDFLSSPLEGAIGMSLALQWRYNFGPLFGKKIDSSDE